MVPSLLSDYKKFERIMKRVNPSSNYIDTSNERFLAPTTLIPLLCYAKNKDIHKIYVNNNTEDYVVRILNREETDTNTPYQILPKSAQERQDKQLSKCMVEKIANKWGTSFGGYYPLLYIFTELTNNIYNHTSFEEELSSQGYTYAQQFPNLNVLELCIMDDGLSIPGKFGREGIPFEDDCHAIEKAINKTSTASTKHNPRGDGLWSTIRLVVEGNGGSVLIVSGKGLLHIQNEKKYSYQLLNNGNIFKGTLISLRLKNNEIQGVRDYIEEYPGRKYKYKGGF